MSRSVPYHLLLPNRSERPAGKLEDHSYDLPPVPHAENKEAKEGHRDHRKPEGQRLGRPVERTVV